MKDYEIKLSSNGGTIYTTKCNDPAKLLTRIIGYMNAKIIQGRKE